MKSLLIALLLAIFSIQAAFVAVSEHVPVTTSVETHANAQTSPASDAEADLLQASTAIEALSDYLPTALSFAGATFTAPTSRQSTQVLLSIDLPRITPPPRA